MQSQRALGVFALSAVILAAISFAAVDVTVATATGESVLPAVTVVCAVIGTLALLAGVLPAITWLINAIHHAGHDAHTQTVPVGARRRMAPHPDFETHPAFEERDR